ncbi:TPA: serine--tRNA ligase, partial [Clostridioides difficile]
MLDIKRIRENLDCIKKAMERRGEKDFNLDEVVKLDDERRKILQEVEVMKNELNTASKNIPNLIKEGKDVENEKIKLKELSDKIKVIDQNLKEVEDKMGYLLMRIPNVPHPEVPQGETDEDNVEVRTWGKTTT